MTQTFSRAISRMSRWLLLAAVLTGLAGASVVDAATADPLSADEAKARDEALEFFKAGRDQSTPHFPKRQGLKRHGDPLAIGVCLA